MKIAAFFCSMLFLFAVGCTGSLTAYEKETAQLASAADTIVSDLNRIDTVTVRELYAASSEIVSRFKTFVNDTLTLDFAYRLDSFLVANKQLEDMVSIRDSLSRRAVAARERCSDLHADILNGAGERSEYARFIRSERADIRYLKAESKSLLEAFETSKSAIAQFQPEIERFISRFVEPVTAP